MGAPLVSCAQCGMKGNGDRNASLVIGQRLITRYEKPFKEKPPALWVRSREKSRDLGVVQYCSNKNTSSLG